MLRKKDEQMNVLNSYCTPYQQIALKNTLLNTLEKNYSNAFNENMLTRMINNTV